MWVTDLTTIGINTNDPRYKLVTTTGALSKQLQSMCNKLSVQVVSQKITAEHGFIREVYLLGDNKPWIHAITTIPKPTYLHFKAELDQLGTKLLGESFLYKQSYSRSDFEYAILDGTIARRSIFKIQEHKITVQENFKLF